MKKITKSIICMLLSIILVFSALAGCSNDVAVSVPETTVTEQTTEKEIIVSDEVKKLAADTKKAVVEEQDIASDELAPVPEDEADIVDEGAIEPDAQVEQEDISYDGTNTVNGKSLLGKCTGLTYYSQADSRWAKKLYTSSGNKSQTIKTSGCGPTCAAMVVSSSKGAILPTTMAQLSVDNGYRTRDNGTAWSFWSFVADYFDFSDYDSTTKFDTMLKYLKKGYFVVVSCGNGLFTTGGHYIVLVADKDGVINIYDPYLYKRKFNTASRRAAKAVVDGVTVKVSEASFKKYANYKRFWIFSNDYKPKKTNKPFPVSKTITKYVKTNGSVLNVRTGAGTKYTKVKTLKNGAKVTVYSTKNGWSRIHKTKKLWVSSKYLTTKRSAAKKIIAYVYIPATGRYAYCLYSKTEKANGLYRLKGKTTLYSKSNLTGKKYNYLAKTKVIIKKKL